MNLGLVVEGKNTVTDRVRDRLWCRGVSDLVSGVNSECLAARAGEICVLVLYRVGELFSAILMGL